MRLENISSVFLKTLPLLLYLFFIQYEAALPHSHRSYVNSINGKNRRIKKRIRWSDVNKRIGDHQFCRMFRMTRACFNALSQHIFMYFQSRTVIKYHATEKYIKCQ